ncbi:hypothetical protein [Methylobacterium planeticum]|uniref:Uncharacterized protein n=1 Tax=Methylobacterium planeticum TaxID=2615211 RepID=A0A6N6MHN8_9HYPH|nr:hypothetical protein [Methylobacterium planeticum]KAB1070493.1 hypothetical protein F6X51_22435 [Methylobacterium planeticum]
MLTTALFSAPWLPPLVRAVATGLIVVLASAIAEAAGPFWGALVISLPVTAGPAYVFMALQHEAGFIAAAALNGFAANAATGAFLIVYAKLGPGHGLARAFGPAVLTWLAAALAIAHGRWTPLTALLLNCAVYGAGIVLCRARARPSYAPSPVARRRWLDLVVRAVAVALFVTGVIGLSAVLSPARTGVIAAFPMALTCTIVILHPRVGGAATAHLASTAIRGVFGFGLTLLTLHLLAESRGVAAALVSALLVSLAWSAALLGAQRLRMRRPGRR